MREILIKSENFENSSMDRKPEDWEVSRIEELAFISSGSTPNRSVAAYWQDGTIPWVKTGEINYTVIKSAEEKITQKALNETSVTVYPVGTVLVAMYGQGLTRGKVGILGIEATTNQACAAIIPKNENLIPSYLFHYLTYHYENIRRISHGSNQSNLSESLIASFRIRLPPKEEQRKIAEILNTVDAAIAHTSSLIAKLKQMKAGLLHDLLTRGLDENGELRDAIALPEQFKDSPLGRIPKDWEVLKLESLLNGRPKNGYSPKEVNEWTGTLMLGLGCLNEEGFEPLQLKNAPSNDLKIRAALLNDGDFLLSRSNTRERVALAGIYRHVGLPCIYSDLMMRLSLNEKTCNRFLELLLRHFPIKRQLTGSAQGTSVSMVKISSQTVIETVVALPNPTEQARIIECVDTYDTRIRAEEAYRDKLKLQKQGLMHDLLTGKVRVKI